MKFLQKRWVAVTLAVLMVVAAIGIGQARVRTPAAIPGPGLNYDLDESLSTKSVEKFLWDDGGVLSSDAKQRIHFYNANWNYRYESVVALVTTDSKVTDTETFAWDQALDMGLGEGDAILAISVQNQDYFIVPGNDFATILTNRVVSDLEDILSGKLNDKTVLAFYEALNQVYLDNFGLGNAQGGYSPSYDDGGGRMAGIVMLAVILIAIVLVINAIDRMRYNTYRTRYYGVVNPPVVFRPIFFWHGPGSYWYRRHWQRPPPPPPPRPPRGPGPGGGSFGGGSSTGFGGAGNRGPRGGGTREADVPAALAAPLAPPPSVEAGAGALAAPVGAASGADAPAALAEVPGAAASGAGADDSSQGEFLHPGNFFWTYPLRALHRMEATDDIGVLLLCRPTTKFYFGDGCPPLPPLPM